MKIKRSIQKIAGLVALSTWLVGYEPVCAAAPGADPNAGDRFFDANKGFPWHIGVQTHFIPVLDGTIKAVRFPSGGLTLLIGPFVEWKPCNGIGIRCGLMYSYSKLTVIKSGRYSSLPGVEVDMIKFHALNFPLHLRFYPGKDRQFLIQSVCYWVTPFAAKQFNVIKQQNKQFIKHLHIDNYSYATLGIGYKMRSGFMIGVGLDIESDIEPDIKPGIELGYDFTKLVIKHIG